jgi:tetratricopeptide (TPR) repeat protein
MFEGDMAADMKDWGSAAGKYEMATSFEVNATEGYVKGANMYFQINPAYSIELLKKLLELNPTSALGQRELANKYYDNNKFKEAVVEYEK